MNLTRFDRLKSNISLYYFAFISLFITLYHKIFANPNNYLFTVKGDGIKNYFTYNYYIKHNKSIFNFEGINYPYGENIFYTDSTPIVSVSIRFLKSIFPSIDQYSIGILNFLMISSYIFCFHFLFQLFKNLNVQRFLAFIGALGITLLSPQFFRLTGHLSLGISFFIPLTFYYIHKIFTGNNSKITLLASWIFIAFCTHAYLGFISFSIAFSLFFLQFIFSKVNQNLSKIPLKSFVVNTLWLVSPLFLFKTIVFLTDSHTGRTTNPFGFFQYYANLNSFLKPIHGGYNQLFSYFLPTEESNWEALNYLGLVSILTLPIILFYLIRQRKKEEINKTFISTIFLSGLFFALYSMCIPFKFNLQELVDLFSILKQFRALGRFGWITFYAIGISSIYLINELSIKNKSKQIRFLINISLLIIYLFESLPYHTNIAKQISSSHNYFIKTSSNIQLTDYKLTPHNYQAIIPFPYYFIGTENHEISIQNEEIVKSSMLLSYHTGIPLMSNYLSRSSIWEGKNTIQFLGPRKYKKLIKLDIIRKTPFLIYQIDTNLRSFEKNILSLSKPISKNNQSVFYSLPYDTIFKQKHSKEKSENTLIIDGFENHISKIKRKGKGSFKGTMNKYEIIKQLKPSDLNPNTEYKVSFWVYNDGKNFGQDVFCQQTFIQTVENEKATWITDIYSAKNSVIIDNNWTLVSFNFKTLSKNTIYQVVSFGDPLLKTAYIIDDLIIEPAN